MEAPARDRAVGAGFADFPARPTVDGGSLLLTDEMESA